eukprot:8132948-Heterocapsa_arctica.AAC.1
MKMRPAVAGRGAPRGHRGRQDGPGPQKGGKGSRGGAVGCSTAGGPRGSRRRGQAQGHCEG